LKNNHKIISDSEETGACIKACVSNLQSLTKTVVLQHEKDCTSLQEEFSMQKPNPSGNFLDRKSMFLSNKNSSVISNKQELFLEEKHLKRTQ